MTLLGSKRVAACATVVLMGSAMYLVMRTLSRTPPGHRPIRAAGPESMSNPPRNWDMVDEQSDQSFPASDPPGNY